MSFSRASLVRAGLVGAAVSLLAAGTASACSCMRPEAGVIEQLRAGAVVARGASQILPPRPPPPGGRPDPTDPIRFAFTVRQALGARLDPEILVVTAANSAMCGVNIGRRDDVILLLSPGEGGQHHISLCGQLSIDAFEADWRTLFEAMEAGAAAPEGGKP